MTEDATKNMVRRKYAAVQDALKGLNVEYRHSRPTQANCPTQALVNGYSIIWHDCSFGFWNKDEVEIRLHDGECVRIPIGELRDQVEVL